MCFVLSCLGSVFNGCSVSYFLFYFVKIMSDFEFDFIPLTVFVSSPVSLDTAVSSPLWRLCLFKASVFSLFCCLCSLPACLPAFLWDFLDRSLVVLIPFVVRFGYVWSPLGPYFVLGFASAPPMSLCLHVLCSAVWFLIHLMIHTVHETDILAFIYAFPPEKCQHIFCEKGLWLTCSAVN